MLQIPCPPRRQQAAGILREHGRALTAPSRFPHGSPSGPGAEARQKPSEPCPRGASAPQLPQRGPARGGLIPSAPQQRLSGASAARGQTGPRPPNPAPFPRARLQPPPVHPGASPHSLQGLTWGPPVAGAGRGAAACARWAPPLRDKMAAGVARSRRGLSPPPSPRGTPGGGRGGWRGGEGRGEKGCPRPPGRGWSNRSAARRAVRPIGAARPQGGTRARPRWPRGEGAEL